MVLVRDSFQRFVRPRVAVDEPAIVCVIGKMVYQALAERPLIDAAKWIYQSNSRGDLGRMRRQQLAELAKRIHR